MGNRVLVLAPSGLNEDPANLERGRATPCAEHPQTKSAADDPLKRWRVTPHERATALNGSSFVLTQEAPSPAACDGDEFRDIIRAKAALLRNGTMKDIVEVLIWAERTAFNNNRWHVDQVPPAIRNHLSIPYNGRPANLNSLFRESGFLHGGGCDPAQPADGSARVRHLLDGGSSHVLRLRAGHRPGRGASAARPVRRRGRLHR